MTSSTDPARTGSDLVKSVRRRSLVLATVNMCQPVTLGSLEELLSQQLEGEALVEYLQDLLGRGYIVVEEGHYRATSEGLQRCARDVGKTVRDSFRMRYLCHQPRQRGGV